MSAYAGHLANLQDKTKVVASEDILSDKGVLIAESGAQINKRICSDIIRFSY
jgi:hypothetical protein